MSNLQTSEITLCYDGTLEGYLSLVFEAYVLHIRPCRITHTQHVQLSLEGSVRETTCNLNHAERVKVGICNRAGFKAYRNVEHAFLSCTEKRERLLFDYITGCMSGGHRFTQETSNPVVAHVEKLALRTRNEAEKMRQFVRFEQLENGAYFATINPQAMVLPLIMSYFAERFNTQPFLIHDETHHLCGVYDLHRSFLVPAEGLEVPSRTDDESRYRYLWKTFYDALACEQRYNPNLRRSFMPKRYWHNLTEMRGVLEHAS